MPLQRFVHRIILGIGNRLKLGSVLLMETSPQGLLGLLDNVQGILDWDIREQGDHIKTNKDVISFCFDFSNSTHEIHGILMWELLSPTKVWRGLTKWRASW